MNPIEKLLFGDGLCKGCGQIKPLVMVEMAGVTEDEATGELMGEFELGDMIQDEATGEATGFHPRERRGFCLRCAREFAANLKR